MFTGWCAAMRGPMAFVPKEITGVVSKQNAPGVMRESFLRKRKWRYLQCTGASSEAAASSRFLAMLGCI